MNVANLITFIRILCVPLLIYLIFHYPSSVYLRILFSICMLSDFLDGLIARSFKLKTTIGSILDPMADKIFLLSLFISFAILQKIPMWLLVIILTRDTIIVFGWLTIYLLTRTKTVIINYSGKLTIFFEMFSLFFIIFNLPYQSILFYFTAVTALYSTFDYCLKGAKQITNL